MVETTRQYETKPSAIISILTCLLSTPDIFTVICDKHSTVRSVNSHTQILYNIIAIVIVATQFYTSKQLAW